MLFPSSMGREKTVAVERGFRVTVNEAKHTHGGKARSIFVPGTGTGGGRDLPGEHEARGACLIL